MDPSPTPTPNPCVHGGESSEQGRPSYLGCWVVYTSQETGLPPSIISATQSSLKPFTVVPGALKS